MLHLCPLMYLVSQVGVDGGCEIDVVERMEKV